MTKIDPATEPIERARTILSSLPRAHAAFAYGSAIFPQTSACIHGRMIDLIIVVQDAKLWHGQNLERNPSHYSFPMTLLGAGSIANVQNAAFGAQIYYNTIMRGRAQPSFKYGVVDLRHLLDDLLTWQTMYLSGRLHKPVHYLTHDNTPPPSLANAITANLEAAAAAALLTLPERFAERDFYTAVTHLSYRGDIRTHLGFEPSTKVTDIVTPNMDRFRNLYTRTRTIQQHTHGRHDGATWTRNMTQGAQARLLHTLPPRIRHQIADTIAISTCCPKMGSGGEVEEADDAQHATTMVAPAIVSNAVLTAVAATVARSSLTQSIKGLVTAGVTNSVRYLAAKLHKSIRARSLRPMRAPMKT